MRVSSSSSCSSSSNSSSSSSTPHLGIRDDDLEWEWA